MTDAEQVPATYQHISCTADDERLTLAQSPMPDLRDNEVLIKVAAAGVNRADILQRKGLYPPPEDASPVLGLEVAGTVAAAGKKATGWQTGERICALTHGGGYAHYAVAPVGQCFPIPKDFSFAEGAALPEALLTIWHNVFERGALSGGDNILIHGGASGMGTMGVMMARAAGANVYTTAGSDEKCRKLQTMGAKLAINYKTTDFESALVERGLGGKINVVLDMIGGDYIQKNLNLAAPEGRIVNIAYMNGFKAEVNFAPVLLKRLVVTGSTLRAQSFAQKAAMRKQIIEHVYPHLRSNKVRPVIDSCFALEQAEAAQEHMLNADHMGKIVLTV